MDLLKADKFHYIKHEHHPLPKLREEGYTKKSSLLNIMELVAPLIQIQTQQWNYSH